MALMPHQTCGICFHWRKSDRYESLGDCRRNPPTVFLREREDGEMVQLGYWPEVAAHDYCGEWAPDK